MQPRNWSNIILAASSVPSALLLAYVLWYMLVYRPSGQEAWGDGVTIFYLGALSYPISLVLLATGVILAVRQRRRRPGVAPTAGPLWFVLSVLLLAAPFVALFAAAR